MYTTLLMLYIKKWIHSKSDLVCLVGHVGERFLDGVVVGTEELEGLGHRGHGACRRADVRA